MDALGDYGSDEEEEVTEDKEEKEEVAGFKPAWEMEDEDSEDEAKEEAERVEKEKAEAAKKAAAEEAVQAKKKRKLPSALDALNSATTTFLQQKEEEEEEEEPVPPSRPPPPAAAAAQAGKPPAKKEAGDNVSARLKQIEADLAAEKAKKLADKNKHNWNAKEKRKRDLGQASKDKNYVEEEKRILRQAGGS
mmetsp:Transcript_28210/g.67776  ORF Transcript_28210/g.67776 Transcript_28210/m.67776 type:complete len:192 (-) Transcript_28210:483-1058(-)